MATPESEARKRQRVETDSEESHSVRMVPPPWLRELIRRLHHFVADIVHDDPEVFVLPEGAPTLQADGTVLWPRADVGAVAASVMVSCANGLKRWDSVHRGKTWSHFMRLQKEIKQRGRTRQAMECWNEFMEHVIKPDHVLRPKHRSNAHKTISPLLMHPPDFPDPGPYVDRPDPFCLSCHVLFSDGSPPKRPHPTLKNVFMCGPCLESYVRRQLEEEGSPCSSLCVGCAGPCQSHPPSHVCGHVATHVCLMCAGALGGEALVMDLQAQAQAGEGERKRVNYDGPVCEGGCRYARGQVVRRLRPLDDVAATMAALGKQLGVDLP